MPTILLIDDDPHLRKMYQTALTSAGFVTTTASDGQEGLDLAHSNVFDLIVLDIMLPKIDGIEFLHRIDKRYLNGHSSIIILTNLRQDRILQKAHDLGIKTILNKSETLPPQLITTLNQLLAH